MTAFDTPSHPLRRRPARYNDAGNMASKAIVVLSGGLDSTVCMALAHHDTQEPPLAVTFDYGQRTRKEIESAARIADVYASEHMIVSLDMTAWGSSALTDQAIAVPRVLPTGEQPFRSDPSSSIPVTYVPGRNIVFLSIALSIAEAREYDAIYIGVNSYDYSGYPDCRPEFIEAFRKIAQLGQKRGVEGNPVDLRAPLLRMSKAEIILTGNELRAPMEFSWSCYLDGPDPCGSCESCFLRRRGFAQAKLPDPSLATQPN